MNLETRCFELKQAQKLDKKFDEKIHGRLNR